MVGGGDDTVVVADQATAFDGTYRVGDLAEGTYAVYEASASGWTATTSPTRLVTLTVKQRRMC